MFVFLLWCIDRVREPLCEPNLLVERGGSVVECRTPEREVGGSKPTAAVLCPWARHFTPRRYWLITQEAVAPSRHDWKIVDCDVKPQHKQTNICKSITSGPKVKFVDSKMLYSPGSLCFSVVLRRWSGCCSYCVWFCGVLLLFFFRVCFGPFSIVVTLYCYYYYY